MSVIDDARILARQKKTITVTWGDIGLPDNYHLRINVNIDGAEASKYGAVDARANDRKATVVIEKIVGDWIVRAAGQTVFASEELYSAVHDFTPFSEIYPASKRTATVHLGNWRTTGMA